MNVLIQRVTRACVRVDGEVVGEIGPGLLAFVAVCREDGPDQARRMAERLLAYRVFPDDAGRMNVSLSQHGGGLLVVSQFTLAADTDRGNRPSFTPAAEPGRGRALFELLLDELRRRHVRVASGRFGAAMQVELVNDGPVTFLLRS